MDVRENSLTRVFDFETGEELLESAVRALEYDEQLALEQGEALENLRPLPGWKLIEDFCFDRIETAKEKLLDAKDLDEIRRQQSYAAAFSNLLGVVDTVIREAQQIREARSNQERDEKHTP